MNSCLTPLEEIAGVMAPRAGRTPYARLGDLFAIGCALAACARPR